MTLYCLEKAPKTHSVRNIGELLIKEREVVLWMLGLSDSLIPVATLITNQQQHAIFFFKANQDFVPKGPSLFPFPLKRNLEVHLFKIV